MHRWIATNAMSVLKKSPDERLLFHCPGCKCSHGIFVAPRPDAKRPVWSWNGSMDKPTFSPSILVQFGNNQRCHSYVQDGKIKFLGDCTHELKNQTVPLPDFDL